MNTLLSKLLEAHVEHELDRFKNGAWKQTIEEEVDAAFDWLQTVRLDDIVTSGQVTDAIRRNLVEYPVPDGLPDLVAQIFMRVLAARVNKKTALGDIFPRRQFADLVEKIAGLKEARDNLIHRIVTGPAYIQMISGVLYNGIKDYLISENIIAQTVPGVSSLIKLGMFAVNKTMKPIETMVETQIRKFIEINIEGTLRRSEKSLIAYFDEIPATKTADKIWRSAADTSLSSYLATIDENDMNDFSAIGHAIWLHFRKTPYFRTIYTDVVNFLFEEYGDRKVGAILADAGISKEMVTREITEAVSAGIETALSTGYLESRIRDRLSDFYGSKKAASLVRIKKPAKAKNQRS